MNCIAFNLRRSAIWTGSDRTRFENATLPIGCLDGVNGDLSADVWTMSHLAFLVLPMQADPAATRRVGPYLITNHPRRTTPISSASSTKAHTRVVMSAPFVSLCSATSFWYSLSSSW